MLDLLSFAIFIVIISYLIILNIRVKNDNMQLVNKVVQLSVDIDILKRVIDSHQTDTEKDHLITFLSETRDVAYTYIDEAQDKLKSFIKDIEKDIYILQTNTADISQKDISKFYKKIVKHYKVIKDMLPKEEDNGR